MWFILAIVVFVIDVFYGTLFLFSLLMKGGMIEKAPAQNLTSTFIFIVLFCATNAVLVFKLAKATYKKPFK